MRSICFCIIIMLVNTSLNAQQNKLEQFIYLIQIPKTKYHPTLLQTGFQIYGVKGIFTSLHGLVDGISFSAKNERNKVFNELKIISVDVDNDVALMSSPELDKQLLLGIKISPSYASNKYYVIGHPAGIELFTKPVTVNTDLVRLSSLIPPLSKKVFENRSSPNLLNQVISINSGNLIPGNSGSPLINDKFNVLGIVGGGLMKGVAGISWAVPITKLKLLPIANVQARIKELTEKNFDELFAFEIDDREKESQELLIKRVNESFGSLTDPALPVEARLRLGHSETIFLAPRGSFALKPFATIPLKFYFDYRDKLVVSTIIRDPNGKPVAVIEDNEWTFYDKEKYEYNNDETAFEIVSKGDRKVLFQIEYKRGVASVFGLFVNDQGAGLYICGGGRDRLTGVVDTMGKLLSNIASPGRVMTIVCPPGEYAFGYDPETRNEIPSKPINFPIERIPIPAVEHLFKYPRERYFGIREDGRTKYPF